MYYLFTIASLNLVRVDYSIIMATYILRFSSYSSTMKQEMGNLASLSIPHALWKK